MPKFWTESLPVNGSSSLELAGRWRNYGQFRANRSPAPNSCDGGVVCQPLILPGFVPTLMS